MKQIFILIFIFAATNLSFAKDPETSKGKEFPLPDFNKTIEEKEIRESTRNFNAKCIDENGNEFLHKEDGFDKCLDRYREQERDNKTPKKIKYLKGRGA